MSELPRGTVTFLFTDIQGSTRLLQQQGCDDYDELLVAHRDILVAAVAAHEGRVVETQGDSFFVAFGTAADGVAAAIDAQLDLAAYPWPEGAEIKVRTAATSGVSPPSGSMPSILTGRRTASGFSSAPTRTRPVQVGQPLHHARRRNAPRCAYPLLRRNSAGLRRRMVAQRHASPLPPHGVFGQHTEVGGFYILNLTLNILDNPRGKHIRQFTPVRLHYDARAAWSPRAS